MKKLTATALDIDAVVVFRCSPWRPCRPRPTPASSGWPSRSARWKRAYRSGVISSALYGGTGSAAVKRCVNA